MEFVSGRNRGVGEAMEIEPSSLPCGGGGSNSHSHFHRSYGGARGSTSGSGYGPASLPSSQGPQQDDDAPMLCLQQSPVVSH